MAMVALILAVGAPTMTAAFSPAYSGPAVSLSMSAQHQESSSLLLSRRRAIATAPAVAGALIVPAKVVADAEAMQWPEALTPESLLPVGDALKLPAIGFGMYNTKSEMAAEAVTLALEAGVRAIDTATMYENEREVGKAWKSSGLKREEVVLSSKLSNVDLRTGNVRKAIETSLKNLQTNYLDAYYIHSPLASPAQREQAWKEMQAMKKQGVIRACGVSNFGVEKIKQLTGGRRPAPDLIQAEISPFNQRRELVTYAKAVNAKVVCAAWSKLSNKETGAQGWGQFAEICGARGMTKAQGLILWSLSRGLVSIPRSGTGSEAEIRAIKDENSPRGMAGKSFTAEDLVKIDALGAELLATGKLGRTDGWLAKDVTGPSFDPTTIRLPLVGW